MNSACVKFALARYKWTSFTRWRLALAVSQSIPIAAIAGKII